MVSASVSTSVLDVDLISGGREDDTVNDVVKQVNWMNLMRLIMSICGGSRLYIPGRSSFRNVYVPGRILIRYLIH